MLILASNSPRRKELLALAGWAYMICSAHVDEQVQPVELPEAYVRRLAESKARAALSERCSASAGAETWIVAADTTVVSYSGAPGAYEILGKPTDAQDAERMLRLLRGRVHQVLTGLALLCVNDGRLLTDVCSTDVPMRDYTDAEIAAYIASGDPMDKAGAYAIQHDGFKPIEHLHGCYANVMGLPLCLLSRLLTQAGVHHQPGALVQTELARSCQQALDYICPVFHLYQ
ncbi:MAG: septum formation protein Maf [Anaerolineales bacterium]|nr:septum formation protein Maf [Anaerolineales bacterium]